MMNKLKLYFDTMSQPSRAVYIFLLTTKIPFEPCVVRLGKGEHMTEEYEKINPLKKVPVIDDGGFILTESVAILRYLCRTRSVADHWYPKDTFGQARVDEYLEWQHLETRANCSLYFRTKFLEPILSGQPANPNRVAKLERGMENVCDAIETVWLKDKAFLCGSQISIADLLGACELEQPRMAGYDVRTGRPILSEWLARVQALTQPHYDVANQRLITLSKKFGGVPPLDLSKL